MVSPRKRLGLHLAVGGDRGGHVEHDRLLVAGRNGRRDRVGRQQHVEAAPGRQVVGVADREVEPDHVMRQRHRRIERCRTGVVGELRVDPGDAGRARLFDRHFGRALHHQMTHAVVAVQHGGREMVVHDADIGPDVEAAGLDAPDILREPGDAMAVGALQVRFRHQAGDGGRILFRQTHLHQRFLNERLEPAERNGGLGHQESPWPRRSMRPARFLRLRAGGQKL